MPQLGLLQNAVERTRRQVIARMTGNCHTPRLTRMLVLAMATLCPYEIPAIGFDQFDYIPNLH